MELLHSICLTTAPADEQRHSCRGPCQELGFAALFTSADNEPAGLSLISLPWQDLGYPLLRSIYKEFYVRLERNYAKVLFLGCSLPKARLQCSYCLAACHNKVLKMAGAGGQLAHVLERLNLLRGKLRQNFTVQRASSSGA